MNVDDVVSMDLQDVKREHPVIYTFAEKMYENAGVPLPDPLEVKFSAGYIIAVRLKERDEVAFEPSLKMAHELGLPETREMASDLHSALFVSLKIKKEGDGTLTLTTDYGKVFGEHVSLEDFPHLLRKTLHEYF